MSLDFNEIRQLLAAIAQTDISEVNLKSENFELTVRRGVHFVNQVTPEAVTLPSTPVSIPSPDISSGVENINRDASDAANGGAQSGSGAKDSRSEEHTSELQSRQYLVCRLLLEKKKTN